MAKAKAGAGMKAMTLTQPWASLVATGAKKIETRSWRTNYRGPLLIHAAQGLGPAGRMRGLRELIARDPFLSALCDPEWWHGDIATMLPRGAIVAVCNLTDCRFTAVRQGGQVYGAGWLYDISSEELAFGDYGPNRYGWFLEDVRRLPEPIPCRGALRLWEPPADVLARVEELLRCPVRRSSRAL